MCKKLIPVLIGCMLLILSCGYHEGVLQPDDKSFILFTGNTDNVEVRIDDNEPFTLYTDTENRKTTHYQISPGNHHILIKRGSAVIVEREILISNGMIKEIQVP